MGLEMVLGLVFGVFIIWAGNIVRTKKVFVFLAGFGDTWQPINEERLGNRVGILLIIIGVIAIFTSVFTIWFGATVGKISGVLAIIDVIMILIVIGLDRIGY
ncbi:hypothetical protein [Lysinibacillus sp. JNUCC-52]|uniref:hypothetical protein n=1 Tax=Lysinibacillus sp. JNUCC-52 TaxID=2792480 RepID=UPI0019379080|nr:hypothetical protein JNUCC52_03660 [Lysinibacillus sp. JNUCC-52]